MEQNKGWCLWLPHKNVVPEKVNHFTPKREPIATEVSLSILQKLCSTFLCKMFFYETLTSSHTYK